MSGPPSRARSSDPDRLQVVLVAILAMWMVVPFAIRGNLGQDALPYVVAGEFLDGRADAIYSPNGDLFDPDPAFARRSCELAPEGTDCANLTVAYVSAPQSLLFARVLSWLGPDAGVLVVRLLGAACLVAGMWELWRRLGSHGDAARRSFVLAALLLTPFVMVPLSLAQTAPILFLATVLGPRWARSVAAEAGVTAIWVGAALLKVFPFLVLPVLVWQRRWRLVAWAAGWLAASTAAVLALGPTSLFADFLEASRALAVNTATNPYNGSLDVLLGAIAPAATQNRTAVLVIGGARVAIAAGLWWWSARRADPDSQWATAWMLALLAAPMVWWHYLWIAIGAIGVLLAARPRDDRWYWALPVAAAVSVPIAVPNGRGWSVSAAQVAFLLVAAAGVVFLARRSPASADPRVPA